MTHPCPDCGTEFDLEDRTIRVRVGTCPGCHRTFTLLPHHAEAGADVAAAAGTTGAEADGTAPADVAVELDEDDDDDEAAEGEAKSEKHGRPRGAEADGDTPVCGTCGSDLVFRAADDVTIEVFCPKCNETTRFRAEGADRPERPEPAEDRPRRPRAGGWQDRGPPSDRRRFDGDAPRGRGCRKCGGPIEFVPTEDGGKEGVCRNCGNRFRLPPLDEGERGDRRSSYRPGGRGGRPSGGGDRGRRPYRPRGPPRRGRSDHD